MFQPIVFSGPTPDNAPAGAAKINANFVELYGGAGTPPDVEVDVTAAADIAAYDVVSSTRITADSANPAAFLGRVVGIAKAAIPNGMSGKVVILGKITNPSWTWASDSPVFLNGTVLSQTPPPSGFLVMVGIAKSPTEIIVQVQTQILL